MTIADNDLAGPLSLMGCIKSPLAQLNGHLDFIAALESGSQLLYLPNK